MKDVKSLYAVLWSVVDDAKEQIERCTEQMVYIGSGGTPRPEPGENESSGAVSPSGIRAGYTNHKEDGIIRQIDKKELAIIDYWEARGRVVKLREMIRALPADQRRAVCLCIKNYTFEEIGERMDIGKTSAWRLYRAGSQAVLEAWYGNKEETA